MAAPEAATECMWSGLRVNTAYAAPPGAEGERPYGHFADANCALAHLLSRKPRGWKRRAAALRALHPDIVPAPAEGWRLDDPRRVAPPQMRCAPRKRKRAEQPADARPPPPPSSVTISAAARLPKVVFTDEKGQRRTLHCEDWRRRLSVEWDLPMDHAMPAFVASNGREFTLYPLLECDGKHLAASDVSVKVTLPRSQFSM